MVDAQRRTEADRFLNGATIMSTPTVEQMRVALEAGFAGIEARAERLLGRGRARERRRAIRGLPGLGGTVLSVNGLGLKVDARGRLDCPRLDRDLDELLDLTLALRSRYLLVVPPRDALASPDAVREGLARALDAGARRGVALGFEFLGFADAPVNTLRGAVAMVGSLPRLGLVVDTCHTYASGGDYHDVPITDLLLMHVNDVRLPASPAIEDRDRVLPGEGRIPLVEAVRALRTRGFGGPWSVETFQEALWDEPAQEVASRAFAALDRLLRRADEGGTRPGPAERPRDLDLAPDDGGGRGDG